MSRKNPFISTSDITSVGTSFSTSKRVTVPLRGLLDGSSSLYFKAGLLSSVLVHLTSISGASELTVRISADSAGDFPIVPDATGTIQTGVTTGTAGSVILHGTEYEGCWPCDSSGQVYLFFKTDAGTVTVDSVVVTTKA